MATPRIVKPAYSTCVWNYHGLKRFDGGCIQPAHKPACYNRISITVLWIRNSLDCPRASCACIWPFHYLYIYIYFLVYDNGSLNVAGEDPYIVRPVSYDSARGLCGRVYVVCTYYGIIELLVIILFIMGCKVLLRTYNNSIISHIYMYIYTRVYSDLYFLRRAYIFLCSSRTSSSRSQLLRSPRSSNFANSRLSLSRLLHMDAAIIRHTN